MKRFLPFQELKDEIEKILVNSKPSFHRSPFEEVTRALCDGRHYRWVAIYLSVPDPGPQPLLEASGAAAAHGGRSRILLSMKRGSREIGLLDVETDRPNGFTAAEIAFLDWMADRLASFLADRGKYLVRKARQVDQKKIKCPPSASAG